MLVTVYSVVMEGTSSETRNLHAWSDKRHLYTNQRKRKEGNPLYPSLEAALKVLLQEKPDLKQMNFEEAWKEVNAFLFKRFQRLVQYFAPDEDQISCFLQIPRSEPVQVVLEEPKEEILNFHGVRKIKLASPASS